MKEGDSMRAWMMAIGLLFAVAWCGGCGSKQESGKTEGKAQVAQREISQVMTEHSVELTTIAGVTGIAIGQLDNGTPCILVLVEKDSAEVSQRIPKEIEGHPTKIMVTGKIVPLQGN
jgi:hypothetical protein